MRILVVGAGIAGPTLAHWLVRGGHEVTILERAPALREGGYLVDFWGAGFDVAERMGIVPALMQRSYDVRELREVDARGRITASMDPRRVVAGAGGRFVSIARADLAATICETVEGRVEMVFDDTVDAIDELADGVDVTFRSGVSRRFDLVVGADGLHSRVRELTFGPAEQFEHYLGIVVSVLVLDEYPVRDELIGVTRTEVGAQALRFSMRDGATMVALTFRHDGAVPLDDVPAQQELVRERLGGLGGEVPMMLERMPAARSFYLDRASQVRMPAWTRGRVALLGDAAACASLLAGQGSALAMTEAYVLAHALHQRDGDHRAAFADYEARLATFLRSKQDAARRMGAAFAPRNRLELTLRSAAMRAMRAPWLADRIIGRTMRDAIELPEHDRKAGGHASSAV